MWGQVCCGVVQSQLQTEGLSLERQHRQIQVIRLPKKQALVSQGQNQVLDRALWSQSNQGARTPLQRQSMCAHDHGAETHGKHLVLRMEMVEWDLPIMQAHGKQPHLLSTYVFFG